jgi:hypothetical protein
MQNRGVYQGIPNSSADSVESSNQQLILNSSYVPQPFALHILEIMFKCFHILHHKILLY